MAPLLTVELGTPGKSGYLANRHVTAHWALYEMHGTADYAKAAIKIWQGALTSCDVCGYPESFRALISYELGLAYLALPGLEGAAAQSSRVFGRPAASTLARSVISTKALSRPQSAKILVRIREVP